MALLKIQDAPLKETLVGDEKIPTGGYGDVAVSINQIKDFTNLSFSNVDNTSDLNKPVSTATQQALDNKTHNSLVGRDVADAHPSSAIKDSSGKTQQVINDELRSANNINNVAYVPNNETSVGVIGGTFRGFAGGIDFIVDTAHDTFGLTSITKADDYTIRVGHDAAFSKVGTLICSPDESLSAMGVVAGASVGIGYSDIKIVAPLYFTVNGSGTITKVSPLFEGSVTAAAGNNPAGGILRYNHPLKSVAAHQAIATSRSFTDNISKPMSVATFNNDGGTYTQVSVYEEQDDSVWIRYNNTNSTFEAAQGINKAAYSFTFNATTGALAITHQAVKTGAYLTIPILTPFNTVNRYSVTSISSTVTNIMCYDPAGNVVKTLDQANWSFFFTIKPAVKNMVLTSIPATNEFTVFVGNCFVPVDNLQKVASGNIWLYGAMNK